MCARSYVQAPCSCSLDSPADPTGGSRSLSPLSSVWIIASPLVCAGCGLPLWVGVSEEAATAAAAEEEEEDMCAQCCSMKEAMAACNRSLMRGLQTVLPFVCICAVGYVIT